MQDGGDLPWGWSGERIRSSQWTPHLTPIFALLSFETCFCHGLLGGLRCLHLPFWAHICFFFTLDSVEGTQNPPMIYLSPLAWEWELVLQAAWADPRGTYNWEDNAYHSGQTTEPFPRRFGNQWGWTCLKVKSPVCCQVHAVCLHLGLSVMVKTLHLHHIFKASRHTLWKPE